MKIYKVCLYNGKATIFQYKVQRIDEAKQDSLYYFNDTECVWESHLDKFNKQTYTVYSLIEERAIRIFEQNMPFYF